MYYVRGDIVVIRIIFNPVNNNNQSEHVKILFTAFRYHVPVDSYIISTIFLTNVVIPVIDIEKRFHIIIFEPRAPIICIYEYQC